MDETTATLPALLEKQKELNHNLDPIGRSAYEMGMAIGGAALAGALEIAQEEAKKWHYIATHDTLVPEALNLRGLQEYLDSAGAPQAILLVDNTNFKAVNEIYGYAMGDKAIKDTYKTLKASVRADDQIARIGGDEFFIVLNGDERNVSPDHPMAHEYRERKGRGIDFIDRTKSRIAGEVQEYLDANPDFRKIGFNLAVGGAVWDGRSVEQLKQEAETKLKEHKRQQHAEFKYERNS